MFIAESSIVMVGVRASSVGYAVQGFRVEEPRRTHAT